MFNLLADQNPVLVMSLGSFCFVAGAVLIFLLVERVSSEAWLLGFKSLVPPLCASLMVAYAIFAVIVANTTWKNQEEAHRTARSESYALKRLLFHMPQEGQGRELLRAYMESAIHEEWPRMSEGRGHPNTTQALVRLQSWSLAPDVPYANANTDKFFQDAVRDLGAAREHRLTLTRQAVPNLLWAALLVSCLVVLVVVAMAHRHNRIAGLIIAALYGTVMGTILLTTVLLDRPYAGSVCVPADHIQEVLNRF